MRPTRIISETAPRIFPKLGTKLGVKIVRNIAWSFFEIFARFLENRSFVRKKYIFCHFLQFLGLCEKSVPRIFLKIVLKCANKIVLKDRIVVSPGKVRYF